MSYRLWQKQYGTSLSLWWFQFILVQQLSCSTSARQAGLTDMAQSYFSQELMLAVRRFNSPLKFTHQGKLLIGSLMHVCSAWFFTGINLTAFSFYLKYKLMRMLTHNFLLSFQWGSDRYFVLMHMRSTNVLWREDSFSRYYHSRGGKPKHSWNTDAYVFSLKF